MPKGVGVRVPPRAPNYTVTSKYLRIEQEVFTMHRLTILFATPTGEPTTSVDVSFATREIAIAVGETIRVGGTPNPWVTYIEEVNVVEVPSEVGSFSSVAGTSDGDTSTTP